MVSVTDIVTYVAPVQQLRRSAESRGSCGLITKIDSVSEDVAAGNLTDSKPSARNLGIATPRSVTSGNRWARASAIGAGAGVALGVAALVVGAGTGHIETFGQFVQDFVKSPGLGGIAALVAAMIAYRGIKGQVEASSAALASQQRAERAARWWTTFQWTADRALPSGEADVPLPKPVAISTLQELALTATDDAQEIACAGLVDALLTTPDVASDLATEEADDERPGTRSHPNMKAQEAVIDAALSSYAKATRGSLAESTVAQRRSRESEILDAVAEAARINGLEFEPEARVELAEPRMVVRVDAVLRDSTGAVLLVDVRTDPVPTSNSLRKLRFVAEHAPYPLLIVSPTPRPRFVDEFPSSTTWLQWSGGNDMGTLIYVLSRIERSDSPDASA